MDKASLQHHGENGLALLRAFGNADLVRSPSPARTIRRTSRRWVCSCATRAAGLAVRGAGLGAVVALAFVAREPGTGHTSPHGGRVRLA
jgi:hypothetical protein